MAQPPLVEVPLSRSPEVLQLGPGYHGHVPVQRYRIPGLWCLHLYSYFATLVIDGHPLEIRPGYVSLTPPGALMEYRYRGPSTHLYAHFRLTGTTPSATIPLMRDAGDRFEPMAAAIRSAVAPPTHDPARWSAAVWAVLWQLADLPQANAPHGPPSHPAVARARAWIEQHLSQPIRVSDLADHIDLSHNHLTRLFHAEMGVTIVRYIRDRRLALARHLLTHTTLSIKAVASQIGMTDLQQFNKYIRRGLGKSPRALRA